MNVKRVSSLAIGLILVFLLGFSCIVYGDEKSSSDLNQQIDDKKTELQEGQEKETKLSEDIDVLTEKINSLQDEIDTIQVSINSTREKIKKKRIELDELTKKVNKQNKDLNNRLRSMYMNDNTSFAEVIMNSGSIPDLLVNLDLIKRIHKADKDALMKLEKQHEKVEKKKEELDSLEASLEENQSKIIDKQKAVEEEKAVINEKRKKVHSANEELKEEIGELQAEASKLNAQVQEMESIGTYEGGMSWPCGGSISCEYGYRYCPFHGYELHSGMDIAVSTGTPIKAASAGVVRQAYYNASYGNMVLIDHGSGIFTLYGHNSQLLVKVGESVAQGTVIAYAGSTGNSTGPHCHFEVRQNGQTVNPRKFL